MYLFSLLLASQIALHSWLHIYNYQKNKELTSKELKPQITSLPADIINQIGTKIDKYLIVKEPGNIYTFCPTAKEGIIPNPTKFDPRLLSYNHFYLSHSYHDNAIYLTSHIRLCLHKILSDDQIKFGSTCEHGPNKNNFVLNFHNLLYLMNTTQDFSPQITCSNPIMDLSDSVLVYSYALAYNHNRFAMIIRPNHLPSHTWVGTLQIYDFKIADLRVQLKKRTLLTANSLLHAKNLCLMGNDSNILFFVDHSDNTLRKIVIPDKEDTTLLCPLKKANSVISFTAHPTLPIGFILKTAPDGSYPLYAVNVSNGKYKLLETVMPLECESKKGYRLPRDIYYDGHTLGIEFVDHKQSNSCDCHFKYSSKLKTISLSICRL